jgi:hypothetical protein
VKRALPLLALVAAVGLVVLLVGSRDSSTTTPDPEPDVTTSSTVPASVLTRWIVPRGTRAASIVDLERHHPVLQITPTDPAGDGGAGVFDQAEVGDLVGRTVRFTASVRVSGSGRAGLFIRAAPATARRDQRVRDLATVVTPDASLATAGPWRRLSVELVVPDGTDRLLYGVSLGGGGSVLVDDADEL